MGNQTEQENAALQGEQTEILVPFSEQEYKSRLDRIRAVMAREKIDMLYLTLPESIYYVSGYRSIWYQAQSAPSWIPLSGIAVHVDHDKFIFFESGEHIVIAQRETVAKDMREVDFTSTDSMNSAARVVAGLKAEGWTGGTVGLEMRGYRPNRLVSEVFQAELESAGCTVVNGSTVVEEVKAILSPAEIDYTMKAAKIAAIGMEAAKNFLHPGVTELAVLGEVINAMLKAGGENSGLFPGIYSGPKTIPHITASVRQIQAGEMVCIDLCGVFRRYHANICRVFFMGEPTKDFRIIGETGAELMAHIKKIVEPHMRVADFIEEIRRFYKGFDSNMDSYWIGGYELGIGFPPDWVGPFVYDIDHDPGEKIFEPGMVVNIENGYGLIDTLVFTEAEAQLIGPDTHQIQVID